MEKQKPQTQNEKQVDKRKPVKSYYGLKRLLAEQMKALENKVCPFEESIKEPYATVRKYTVEALIKKGYLTAEGKPSKLSIEKDYIRENDFSCHFPDQEIQPKLLLTGRFLRVFAKEFKEPPFPVSILKKQTPCNTQND